MLFLALWGCQSPVPPSVAAEETRFANPAPPALGLRLSERGGEFPVSPDTELPLTMLFGPAGGWTLQVDGHVTGLARENSGVAWTGVAEMPDGAIAMVESRLAVDALDGEAVLRDVRHFILIGRNSHEAVQAVCSYEGQSIELQVDLEHLDDGRTTTLIQPVALRLDPINEPDCE